MSVAIYSILPYFPISADLNKSSSFHHHELLQTLYPIAQYTYSRRRKRHISNRINAKVDFNWDSLSMLRRWHRWRPSNLNVPSPWEISSYVWPINVEECSMDALLLYEGILQHFMSDSTIFRYEIHLPTPLYPQRSQTKYFLFCLKERRSFEVVISTTLGWGVKLVFIWKISTLMKGFQSNFRNGRLDSIAQVYEWNVEVVQVRLYKGWGIFGIANFQIN